ncbi:MAG: DUF21 domain-containing protein [Methanobacteriota archaeon]|nr:MAG: DUF21 domain-containing protein [Euryarchaeota archaeon]
MNPLSLAELLVLLLLSAGFSSVETAFLSTTQARINYLAEKCKSGKILKKLKEKQSEVIIAILLGNNLVNIGATALATEISLEVFQNAGIAFATGIMTFLILTFGEVLPKLFATSYAQRYLLKIAPYLDFWVTISTPVVIFYDTLTDLVKQYLGEVEEPSVTEEELEEMVKIGELEGEVGKHERDIILAALDLEEFTAEDIMINRDEIFAMEENESVKELLDKMENKKLYHTRIPIYKNSIDHITGIINLKEIIKKTKDRNWKKKKLKDIAYEPFFVSIYTPVIAVLNKMKESKNLMALVVDEQGIVVGLLTIEDILEVLVGDIYDEMEKVKKKAIRTKDGYIFDASILSEDFEDITGIKLGDVSTLAEFLLKKFKGLPEEGQKIKYKGFVFEVTKKDSQRIRKVRLYREKNGKTKKKP